MKTRALMSIASANEDHNHVITVRKYRNLQEAVQRVVHMDIGRCNVIGFQRLFICSPPCLFRTDHCLKLCENDRCKYQKLKQKPKRFIVEKIVDFL